MACVRALDELVREDFDQSTKGVLGIDALMTARNLASKFSFVALAILPPRSLSDDSELRCFETSSR